MVSRSRFWGERRKALSTLDGF